MNVTYLTQVISGVGLLNRNIRTIDKDDHPTQSKSRPNHAMYCTPTSKHPTIVTLQHLLINILWPKISIDPILQ